MLEPEQAGSTGPKIWSEADADSAEAAQTMVLLLHGWGCTASLYSGILKTCALKYRTAAPDLPGHGASEEPPEPWDADHFADFVLDFLKQFEFKKLILIGHSNGGRIIIKLLTERELPFEVKKVILIDSAGIRNKLPLNKRIRQRVFKIGRGFYETKLMRKLSPDGLDKWRSKFGSADYRAASPVMRQSLVKLVNEDQTQMLPRIKAETLLIWGDRDTATPISDAKTMEKMIPGAGLVTLEGATHFSFLERPAVIDRVLRSFLEIR